MSLAFLLLPFVIILNAPITESCIGRKPTLFKNLLE